MIHADDPVVVVALPVNQLIVVVADMVPDSCRLPEIHRRARYVPEFACRDRDRIHRCERIRVDLHIFVLYRRREVARQIEVAVVRHIADRILVGYRREGDLETRIRQLESDLNVQFSGKSVISVWTCQREGQDILILILIIVLIMVLIMKLMIRLTVFLSAFAALADSILVDLRPFPDLKALRTAVILIPAVVGRQRIFRSVQRKPRVTDPVGTSSDAGAEILVVSRVICRILIGEDDVRRLPVSVRHEDLHDPSAVIGDPRRDFSVVQRIQAVVIPVLREERFG